MRKPFDNLDVQPIGGVGARALGQAPRFRFARDECEARGAPRSLTAARGAFAQQPRDDGFHAGAGEASPVLRGREIIADDDSGYA